jgi:ribosomal-protein-alanine N-acetyltransferase
MITDLDRIDEIEQQSFNNPYPRAFLNYLYHTPSSIFLVADAHMTVGGYIIASTHHNLGRIISIATHPIKRGKMIGRTLMGTMLKILRAKGVTTVRLEVRLSNIEAQRFYEQFEFRYSHCITRYYGDEDALVYLKRLR